MQSPSIDLAEDFVSSRVQFDTVSHKLIIEETNSYVVSAVNPISKAIRCSAQV